MTFPLSSVPFWWVHVRHRVKQNDLDTIEVNRQYYPKVLRNKLPMIRVVSKYQQNLVLFLHNRNEQNSMEFR